MPYDDSRAQQEKRLLFFPGKDPANEITWTLFTIALPNFFSSIKAFSFPCCRGIACGLPWLQTQKCNSLSIPSKPIFAREISDSLFQVNILMAHKGTREDLKDSRVMSKQVWYPQLSPLCSLLFLPTLRFEGMSFSWIQALTLFVFKGLQALFGIYFKVLFFWLRPCSVCKYLFGILV